MKEGEKLMGAILEMLFPEGKKKALTLSYDDGTVHDRKLVAMMNQYGVRGTFNLNSGIFSEKKCDAIEDEEHLYTRIAADEVQELYEGHEVASHTLTHPSLTALPSNMGAAEVLKDRKNLEELTGKLVRGFAYPYGTYNDVVESMLDACGIEYARTVCATNGFSLPDDFLEWHPTCHHNADNLMELAEQFCTAVKDNASVFYLWGHSYEFARYHNWDVLENFLKYISGYRDEIWMTTNIEIVDYVKDFGQLRRSTDGSIIYNPTGKKLWFELAGKVYCINGNETLHFEE